MVLSPMSFHIKERPMIQTIILRLFVHRKIFMELSQFLALDDQEQQLVAISYLYSLFKLYSIL